MLLIRTLLWLRRTATGDRAELRLSPEEDEAWSKVAAAAEVCSPLRCSFHREGSCFVARARRAADSAHVVIVNHSLLLSDVVTGNQVLPEYRHLIVDEAHHLEDEATAQLEPPDHRARGGPAARRAGRRRARRRRRACWPRRPAPCVHAATDEPKQRGPPPAPGAGPRAGRPGPERAGSAVRDARDVHCASRRGAATAARSRSG